MALMIIPACILTFMLYLGYTHTWSHNFSLPIHSFAWAHFLSCSLQSIWTYLPAHISLKLVIYIHVFYSIFSFYIFPVFEWLNKVQFKPIDVVLWQFKNSSTREDQVGNFITFSSVCGLHSSVLYYGLQTPPFPTRVDSPPCERESPG